MKSNTKHGLKRWCMHQDFGIRNRATKLQVTYFSPAWADYIKNSDPLYLGIELVFEEQLCILLVFSRTYCRTRAVYRDVYQLSLQYHLLFVHAKGWHDYMMRSIEKHTRNNIYNYFLFTVVYPLVVPRCVSTGNISYVANLLKLSARLSLSSLKQNSPFKGLTLLYNKLKSLIS